MRHDADYFKVGPNDRDKHLIGFQTALAYMKAEVEKYNNIVVSNVTTSTITSHATTATTATLVPLIDTATLVPLIGTAAARRHPASYKPSGVDYDDEDEDEDDGVTYRVN